MKNAHKDHQAIASTLFRCTDRGHLCRCRVPCFTAKQDFENAFRATEKNPDQLHLKEE